MDGLAKCALSSVVLLLTVVGTFTSEECLSRFPANLPLDGSFGDKPHLFNGSYLFPNITIQCLGRVTSIHFSGYFHPDVRYSSIILIRFEFYSQLGDQYKLEDDRTLDLSLESLSQNYQELMTDADGRYHVSSPLVATLTSDLRIPVQVTPGYILGVSLPTTESLSSQVISHGVSIVVQDDPRMWTLRNNDSNLDMSETWLPVQGMMPIVQLEFIEEVPPTSEVTVEVSSFYIAIGLAGLFACLFLFAAVIALILVVVIVVIQKKSKLAKVGATDPSQQLDLEEDTLETNHVPNGTESDTERGRLLDLEEDTLETNHVPNDTESDTERGRLLAVPTTKHLQFYVVNKVGGQWKVFCRALGVTEVAIGTANANNPGNINEAMMQALQNFLSGAPDPPFTWLSVLHAFGLLGMTDYAKELKCCIIRGELDLMNISV